MRFTVTRVAQSLVGPSAETPSETLNLSIIDHMPGIRHMVRSLHVFKHGQRPAKVVKEALSKALVPYYPLAGRFVDAPDRGKVAVECRGQGAWFVEATAGCSLEDVKYLDHPLLISEDDLLPDPRPETDPLDLPVMMQVTEFKCGGFVVGLVSIHAIADGLGAAQFIKAVGELARGLTEPSTAPVWGRHLIPNPPKPPPGPPPVLPSYKLKYSTFHLPADHIAKTKGAYFDVATQHCSAFDVSVATVWQARTRALNTDPGSPVRLCFFANARHLSTHEAISEEGRFYGNCFYPVTVTSSGGDIMSAGIVEIVRLVRDGKAKLAGDFARWARGGFREDPYGLDFTYDTLFVSDWSKLGFLDVDYGWGKPVHVIPFAYYDFMAVAVVGRPRVPGKGAWLMTQCVKEEHLQAFEENMISLM